MVGLGESYLDPLLLFYMWGPGKCQSCRSSDNDDKTSSKSVSNHHSTPENDKSAWVAVARPIAVVWR